MLYYTEISLMFFDHKKWKKGLLDTHLRGDRIGIIDISVPELRFYYINKNFYEEKRFNVV